MQARMWDCSKTRCPKSWYYSIRAPFLDSRTGKRQVVPHGLFLALFLMDLPVFKTGSIIWSWSILKFCWSEPSFNQHFDAFWSTNSDFAFFFFQKASLRIAKMPRPSAKDGKDGRNAVARSVHWVISPSLSLYMYVYICIYIEIVMII
jgi:hypothetical protein